MIADSEYNLEEIACHRIYPCMTKDEADWLCGKQFICPGLGAIVVVGREEVGFSQDIHDHIYVAVVEDAAGILHLRDLQQIGEEMPYRYEKFRGAMLIIAESEGEN